MPTITLPYDINNGDALDADKVMANENAIVSEYNASVAAKAGDVVSTTETQTIANKTINTSRINKRVGTETSSATSTPTADTVDIWTVTALAAADTFAAPTGTPTSGQTLVIRIKDDGTARALDFNAIYRFSTDLAKPTTTVLGKTIYLGFIYNSASSTWDCVAKLDNF